MCAFHRVRCGCIPVVSVQFANPQQATRVLTAVEVVKGLLGNSEDDKAVLAGAKKWKASDADAKVPVGKG